MKIRNLSAFLATVDMLRNWEFTSSEFDYYLTEPHVSLQTLRKHGAVKVIKEVPLEMVVEYFDVRSNQNFDVEIETHYNVYAVDWDTVATLQ